MKWKKQGLIYSPLFDKSWRDNSALQPTPLVLGDKIRFYVGFRDAAGVSRIGFVDVDVRNPQKILNISKSPVLDIGDDGAFDEFGVVPSAVIKVDDKIYLYYAGYQLGKKVRFLVLSGLAISEDGGNTFKRHSRTPVFERTDNEMLFRVPHSVINQNGLFKFWYGGGFKFIRGKKKTLPVYDVKYLESHDGIDIPKKGTNVLTTKSGEYRIGRPFVLANDHGYIMFYGYSSEEKHYQLGYAVSDNGISWNRKDDEIGIRLSDSGWDSEMMAYPSLVQANGKTYLFYNGNEYGRYGFGFAVLDGELK